MRPSCTKFSTYVINEEHYDASLECIDHSVSKLYVAQHEVGEMCSMQETK